MFTAYQIRLKIKIYKNNNNKLCLIKLYVNNADDTAMLADNMEDRELLLNKINEQCVRCCLKINIAKSNNIE